MGVVTSNMVDTASTIKESPSSQAISIEKKVLNGADQKEPTELTKEEVITSTMVNQDSSDITEKIQASGVTQTEKEAPEVTDQEEPTKAFKEEDNATSSKVDSELTATTEKSQSSEVISTKKETTEATSEEDTVLSTKFDTVITETTLPTEVITTEMEILDVTDHHKPTKSAKEEEVVAATKVDSEPTITIEKSPSSEVISIEQKVIEANKEKDAITSKKIETGTAYPTNVITTEKRDSE